MKNLIGWTINWWIIWLQEELSLWNMIRTVLSNVAVLEQDELSYIVVIILIL